MTYTDEVTSSASPQPSPWETCDHCQAPLDERQRYCVACGARRAHSDDPVARYFVTSARRARSTTAAVPAAPAPRPTSGLKFAIVLALIPVAAAIGVVAGRDSTSENELLLQALKAQKAPVVNVGAGDGSGATADADSGKDGGGKDKKAKQDDNPNDADGKVIAKTEYGSARQLTGSKVTEAQKAESKKAIEHIVNSKGKEYVEQQRNLPDQIVIP